MKARIAKPRSSSLITSRKIVGHEHLNPNGTLFGGYLMSWMDEVAFMCARRFSGRPTCVTASVDSLSFKTPLFLGEHVFLSATVCAVGRTSMQIEVLISKEDPFTGECNVTNAAYLTFVCLDEKLKPITVPDLLTETQEDIQKNREAKIRYKVRKRLNAYLDKRLKCDYSDLESTVSQSKARYTPLLVEKVLKKAGLSIEQFQKLKSYRHFRRTVESII
jgi:acyl-CoA hydrolase